MKKFPMNAWYAVAWDIEISRKLLAKTVCGVSLVLYRTLDGKVACLEDACWHRMVPLSQGKLIGNEIQCRYHGLKFDCKGACTHMPAQQTINPTARVRSFPAIDRHRFIWVWMGDPLLADEQTIPNLGINNHHDWAGDGETIFADCDYRLVIDNLLDLTHVSFLHESSIGGEGVSQAPVTVTHGGNRVTVTRWMIDIDPPPLYRQMLGKPGNVDRWQIISFEAPCTVCIDVGVAPTGSGAPQGDRSEGVGLTVINTITPATETTSHYFWSHARNYDVHNEGLTQRIKLSAREIFEEDREMLALQQAALSRYPDRTPYDLSIDSGGVWARKAVEQMILSEI